MDMLEARLELFRIIMRERPQTTPADAAASAINLSLLILRTDHSPQLFGSEETVLASTSRPS
jgi:hypothetical protein